MDDTGGLTYEGVVNSLNYVVTNVLLLAGFITVGAMVYYGLRMAMARENASEFSKAKGMLIYASIGAAVIFGVYTIIATVRGAAQSIGQ